MPVPPTEEKYKQLPSEGRLAWIQDAQIIPQRAIIVEQIRRRRHILHLLARQINSQQIRALERNLHPRWNLAAQNRTVNRLRSTRRERI